MSRLRAKGDGTMWWVIEQLAWRMGLRTLSDFAAGRAALRELDD